MSATSAAFLKMARGNVRVEMALEELIGKDLRDDVRT